MRTLVCNLVVAAAFVASPRRRGTLQDGRPVARVADEVDVRGPGAAYLAERLEMSAAELRSPRARTLRRSRNTTPTRSCGRTSTSSRGGSSSRGRSCAASCSARPRPRSGSRPTTNLAPTLDFLAAALGLDGAADDAAATDALRRIVLRLPGVLGLSVPNNLAPKLEFLDRALGLSGDPVPLRASCSARRRCSA